MLSIKPNHIPTTPGVYFFQDGKGKTLYIGKAANLKSRLGSYFKKQPHDTRITAMLARASKVRWQETPSEIEALILESQLIKKKRPPFNVLLRDDKQYFYVTFTADEFPRIYLTHQPQRYTDYIGPFTDGHALRTTLKLLRRVFPYCTCKQKHHHPCLNFHLGKCAGYCCLKHHETANIKHETKEYGKNIKAIKKILTGKKSNLSGELHKQMSQAAKKENFTKAIELRDKLGHLERVFENARIIKGISEREGILRDVQLALELTKLPRRIEGYDISNIQGEMATGAMIAFTNGQPDTNEYRKFKIRLGNTPDDTAMLREVLSRRFNHPEWPFPDLILIDGGKGQLNAAIAAIFNFQTPISNKFSNSKPQISEIPIIALTKNEKHRGDHIFISNQKEPVALKDLPPAVSDFILHVDSEAHRFAIQYYRELHRKAL
ncbi:MAG: GIY-YIG nuclease family protein [bacterium]|nr:GIY-YIG nuclease family protein [bacterium]